MINIIAALPFYSDYDSPFLFTLLPGGSLMLFARYITKPSVAKRSLCNRALIVSLLYSCLSCIILPNHMDYSRPSNLDRSCMYRE